MLKFARIVACLALGMLLGGGVSLAAAADTKPRILFVTQSKGFKHGSVTRGKEGKLSPAEVAVTQLAQSSGEFTVHCSQDAGADVTKENLQNYDIVWFYTTGDLPITAENLDYFLGVWLKQKGHGFIGSHSAADTYHKHQPYWDMIGGTFRGHSWNSKEKVTIAVHEPEHPVASGWGKEFEFTDEIYEYKNWQPEKVRVLMSLDMSKCRIKKPYHVPVVWVKEFGEGRVYFNNLGHNPETWTNKTFQQSLLHAIAWVSGKGEAHAAPNPELSKLEEEKARAVAPPEEPKKPAVPKTAPAAPKTSK